MDYFKIIAKVMKKLGWQSKILTEGEVEKLEHDLMLAADKFDHESVGDFFGEIANNLSEDPYQIAKIVNKAMPHVFKDIEKEKEFKEIYEKIKKVLRPIARKYFFSEYVDWDRPTIEKKIRKVTDKPDWYEKPTPDAITEYAEKDKKFREDIVDEMKKSNEKIAKKVNEYIQKKASIDNILPLLQKSLQAEIQQWDMYYTYADLVKGLSRDGIAEHFIEHAGDEEKHIQLLTRYIVDMGGKPTLERLPIPEGKVDAKALVELQLEYELKAVENYTNLLKNLSEGALKIDIENLLIKEQEHAQDFKKYLG